jgi:DNA ligase (NAD+)
MNTHDIVEKLIEAKEAYYLGNPIMTDSEFDELEDELREVDPKNNYFKKVGMQLAGVKVKHTVRMRSMQKCNTFEGLKSWEDNSLKIKTTYLIEDKIDGLSGSLKYKDGVFYQAVTRGNGEFGQEVTENAKLISSIPKTISYKGDVEIRGEFVLPKDTKMETNGKPLRNLAAGLINRKSDAADCKYLDFISYNILNIPFRHEEEKLDMLLGLGFKTFSSWNIVDDVSRIQDVYQKYIDGIRAELPYEIDGLIILPNDCHLQDELEDGNEHHPTWALAYKFPNEEKTTTLRRIDWQVSKNGFLVPVSNFDPIYIGGAEIKRATLNNAKNVLENNVAISNRIVVSRANDVIPFFKENLDKSISHPELPDECPCCGTAVVWNGVHLQCPNSKGCREQVIGKIKSWVAALDADFVASATIDLLWDNNLIHSITDLYKLTADDLRELDGFGDRKAENFVYQLEKSKEMPFSRFAGKLSIPNVGVRAIKKLEIKSYDDFLKFNNTQYAIGRNIVEWKKESGNLDMARELHDCIKIIDETVVSGVKVCATGKAPVVRSEIVKLLETNGFAWNDGVDKEVKFLITDDVNSTSSKAVKARKLGIPIMTYTDFFKQNNINA